MSSNTIYVTYLTIYYGSKLPMFYIGSTSLDKINKGYRGSVSSKKYKSIWEFELKNSPHLFKTKILTKHNSRQDATTREYKFQKLLSVVKSGMYINRGYATVNGHYNFGMIGENNPFYGKSHSEDNLRFFRESQLGEKSVCYGRKFTKETLNLLSEINMGDKNPMYGKHQTDSAKALIRDARTGVPRSLESCKKTGEGH